MYLYLFTPRCSIFHKMHCSSTISVLSSIQLNLQSLDFSSMIFKWHYDSTSQCNYLSFQECRKYTQTVYKKSLTRYPSIITPISKNFSNFIMNSTYSKIRTNKGAKEKLIITNPHITISLQKIPTNNYRNAELLQTNIHKGDIHIT